MPISTNGNPDPISITNEYTSREPLSDSHPMHPNVNRPTHTALRAPTSYNTSKPIAGTAISQKYTVPNTASSKTNHSHNMPTQKMKDKVNRAAARHTNNTLGSDGTDTNPNRPASSRPIVEPPNPTNNFSASISNNQTNRSTTTTTITAAVATTTTQNQKDRKKGFLNFTRVLLKYLEKKDTTIHAKAETIIRECAAEQNNRQNNPPPASSSSSASTTLSVSMQVRLRELVGEIYWKKTEDYMCQFLKKDYEKKDCMNPQDALVKAREMARIAASPLSEECNTTVNASSLTNMQEREISLEEMKEVDNSTREMEGIPTKSESFSEWDEGMILINSILLPNSSIYEALSPTQRTTLYKFQQILLDGSLGTSKHIPTQLNYDYPCQYKKYLLSEYAGINKKDISIKKKFAKVVNAHKFTNRSAKAAIEGNQKSLKFYVPTEWTMLSHDIKVKLAGILSLDSLSKWTFDIFEVNKLTNGNILLFLGWAIMSSPYAQYAMQVSLVEEGVVPAAPSSPDDMEGYHFIEILKISDRTLCCFLRSIEGDYNNDNAYHNSLHAADVLQSVHSILTMINNEHIIIFSDLEKFSILLAAVIHDVKHPGRNNAFQINNETEIAILYNDNSVLENMHLSTAFSRIIGEQKDDNINIFKSMQPARVALCRKICIDAVLHTDMTKHFSFLSQMKSISQRQKQDLTVQVTGADILSFVLHMADISNPSKPLVTAMQWTDRCLEESFAQGDEEERIGVPISPLCSRSQTNKAESQVGFIKYVVQPSYEILGKFISKINEEVNPIIKSNLLFWEKEVKESKPEILLH